MRFLTGLFAVLISLSLGSTSVQAASSKELTQVKDLGRQARLKLAALKRAAAKLQGVDKQRAASALSGFRLPDQDHDGVPDVLEEVEGTNACNGSSDGIHNDGAKREREGAITAVSDSSLTVGGILFVIDDNTTLDGITLPELVVDACVQVEGFADNVGTITATKIEAKDNCGTHSGHGDHGGSSSSSSNGDH